MSAQDETAPCERYKRERDQVLDETLRDLGLLLVLGFWVVMGCLVLDLAWWIVAAAFSLVASLLTTIWPALSWFFSA